MSGIARHSTFNPIWYLGRRALNSVHDGSYRQQLVRVDMTCLLEH